MDDEQLLFVHYGPLDSNLNRSAFLDLSAGMHYAMQQDTLSSNNQEGLHTYIRHHNIDIVRLLHLIILHNTSWSFRSYEHHSLSPTTTTTTTTTTHTYTSQPSSSNRTLTEAVASIKKRSANKLAISKKIQEKITGGHNKGKGNRHKAFKASHMTNPQQRRRLASANNKKKPKPKPHPV